MAENVGNNAANIINDDDDRGVGGVNDYPSYEDDEVTLANFLQEYTILQPIPKNNQLDGDMEGDDDLLEEPGTNGLHRVSAYLPQLQQIRNPHAHDTFIPPTGTSTTSMKKHHIIEIPLDALQQWDAVRGQDLALKIMKNTLRYHQLTCTVIDRILDGMTPTTNNFVGHNDDEEVLVRDAMEVLHEQRLENRRRRQEERQQLQQSGQDQMDAAVLGGGLQAPNENSNALEDEFPPALMRRYELRILPFGRPGIQPVSLSSFKQGTSSSTANNNPLKKSNPPHNSNLDPVGVGLSLRHVRSRSMGRLVTLTGMIVRASDVKPQCIVATYTCDQCGVEVYQDVQYKREFLPARNCPNKNCSNASDSLLLQTRGSQFVKFQELKLQELPQQVPMGHIPRSLSLVCRGSLTRLACPGDVVTVDGVFLPMRVAEGFGQRAKTSGLISTTYLECMNITVHKKSFEETSSSSWKHSVDDADPIPVSPDPSSDQELNAQLLEIATGDDPVYHLSQSLAPEIYGHVDIKRALLLQLVGGCERKLPDGMRIRGDINICLMGDPGVAKSQLLKHVSSIAPRGVYTTGRGSSGVGLTAAITKDTSTGEMALEGGALVLADKGICCIDEFDKMDEGDRTAIHEVMEQQTVSIAKAGIVATLNARAAVLAAANPLYGRYHRKKSLSENINLPNSLLSRFDLMFLILDKADVEKDMALARHVTFVHKNNGLLETDENSPDDIDPAEKDNQVEDDATAPTEISNDTHNSTKIHKGKHLDQRILREYISRAREYHPIVPPDVGPYIVEAYVGLRIHDQSHSNPLNSQKSKSLNGDQTVMTARQLLSILRLSQALARLRFSDFVAREDVDEAIRLTHMSKASLLDDDDENENGLDQYHNKGKEDVMSRIFNTIREYSIASRKSRVEVQVVEAMMIRKGFTTAQLQTCLEEYQALQVIQINSAGTHITFMD